MCVKRRAAGDRDRAVKAAARFCREPALERVAGLDGNAARCGRLAVRLYGFGKAGLAVNRAAVCACIPLDCQADGCTAIVADTICVGISVVCIFFAGIAASGAGFRALVLRIVGF